MYFADRAVVVVNPEVSSVRDSDRIIGLLDSKTRKAEEGKNVPAFLLLTRYSRAAWKAAKCSASPTWKKCWGSRPSA